MEMVVAMMSLSLCDINCIARAQMYVKYAVVMRGVRLHCMPECRAGPGY